MAEHRAGTRVQKSCGQIPLNGLGSVPDRVYPWEDAVEIALLLPAVHRPRANPDRLKLGTRDPPELPPRDLSDLNFGVPRVHTSRASPSFGHAPENPASASHETRRTSNRSVTRVHQLGDAGLWVTPACG